MNSEIVAKICEARDLAYRAESIISSLVESGDLDEQEMERDLTAGGPWFSPVLGDLDELVAWAEQQ